MFELFISELVITFQQNPLAQSLGIVAFLVSCYNFLFCSEKKFIFITAIASAIWALHFFALSFSVEAAMFGGVISAAIINVFDIGKNLLGLKYERNFPIVIAISLFYVLVGICTYIFVKPELVGFFPTLTAITSTYLVFYVRGVGLNLGFLGITLLWLVFNISSKSVGGVMTDVFLILFGLVGIWRILHSSKKEEKKKEVTLDV